MRYILIVISFLAISCSSAYDAGLLVGDWGTASWTVLSSGASVDQKMDFHFESEGMYVVDYGTEDEKGAYYLSGEYLHTKENGAIEKSVKITKLTKDTMMIEMNRAGRLERVVLVKK